MPLVSIRTTFVYEVKISRTELPARKGIFKLDLHRGCPKIPLVAKDGEIDNDIGMQDNQHVGT